jgi:hypothetical protein
VIGLLGWISIAMAADVEQSLTWDVQVDGVPSGVHTLTVKYVSSPDGSLRRILESYTEVVSIENSPVAIKRRMTGHAGLSPATFTSVVNDNGVAREVQATNDDEGWRINLTTEGKSTNYELTGSRIDMSTLDLFDPVTAVPIGRYHRAKILSVDDGDILEGEVVRMGNSTLIIDGEKVLVDEFIWTAPQDKWSFFYTPDGFLVRYEHNIGTAKVVGELRDPPPQGLDEAPVSRTPPAIEEADL